MDHDQARTRLLTERAEVADLLAGAESSAQEDRETEDEEAQVYTSDAAQPLAAEGEDDAIAERMRERPAAASGARSPGRPARQVPELRAWRARRVPTQVARCGGGQIQARAPRSGCPPGPPRHAVGRLTILSCTENDRSRVTEEDPVAP